jgi:hypothetical protein
MQKAVCFINGVSIRDAPGFPCVIKDAQQIPQAVILMDQHRLGIVVHLFALSLAIRPKRPAIVGAAEFGANQSRGVAFGVVRRCRQKRE